ncbi:MAG: helix-turn-helix domain-containing protein [Actinomycetia bacterium]|nr:helix-turn-helix domain-containing protein [Actinomycetes bacterium]
MERAVQLMRGSPHRTLSSIAAEVGFATPFDFSRVFRAQFGCSPSIWDRRSRLDGEAGLVEIEHSRALARPPEVLDASGWQVDCSIALRPRRP